jgi:DtxR family transcriptional regulator, Mn-dependent transcriptional regulator
MRTEAVEDYLKSIYLDEAEHGEVTTVALAERMEVSAPSVTGMLKKLADLKLVKHEPYHGVTLTPAGRKIALEVIRHHRLLELYLAEALGYSWDKVHAEAEKLEHHISEEFEDKIAALLGNPVTDPHGDPIPAKDGTIPPQPSVRLPETTAGETVTVMRVAAQDASQLNYLGSLGIRPEANVTFVARAPFDGPVHLRIGSHDHHIGLNLARQIYIRRGKSKH